jgi:hypothetical protein
VSIRSLGTVTPTRVEVLVMSPPFAMVANLGSENENASVKLVWVDPVAALNVTDDFPDQGDAVAIDSDIPGAVETVLSRPLVAAGVSAESVVAESALNAALMRAAISAETVVFEAAPVAAITVGAVTNSFATVPASKVKLLEPDAPDVNTITIQMRSVADAALSVADCVIDCDLTPVVVSEVV